MTGLKRLTLGVLFAIPLCALGDNIRLKQDLGSPDNVIFGHVFYSKQTYDASHLHIGVFSIIRINTNPNTLGITKQVLGTSLIRLSFIHTGQTQPFSECVARQIPIQGWKTIMEEQHLTDKGKFNRNNARYFYVSIGAEGKSPSEVESAPILNRSTGYCDVDPSGPAINSTHLPDITAGDTIKADLIYPSSPTDGTVIPLATAVF